MDFVGNLLLFPAVKIFLKIPKKNLQSYRHEFDVGYYFLGSQSIFSAF